MALIKEPVTQSEELSADELAIWAAVVVIVGDVLALLALIKARNADKLEEQQSASASNSSRRKSKPYR